jgi:hypothetical protein
VRCPALISRLILSQIPDKRPATTRLSGLPVADRSPGTGQFFDASAGSVYVFRAPI